MWYSIHTAPCIATGFNYTNPNLSCHLNRLQKAKQLPHALPAQALCTDGGCDEPFDAYWVSSAQQQASQEHSNNPSSNGQLSSLPVHAYSRITQCNFCTTWPTQ